MKIVNRTLFVALIGSTLLLNGCQEEDNHDKYYGDHNQKSKHHTENNNHDKHDRDHNQISKHHTGNHYYDKRFVSSWLDTSEAKLNFTLLADGTAKSDNMTTLLYKKWRIEGDKIIFTIESIGNGSSSTDEEIYEIVKIDDKELILKQGSYKERYLRK